MFRTRSVIAAGLEARAFPAAAIDVGRRTGSLWHAAFGHLTYDRDASLCTDDTIFDLASLTKVIATTSIAMRQVHDARLSIDTRISEMFTEWRGADRESVTVRHLLDHSSGLPAHMRLWETVERPAAVLEAIADAPLERAPGALSVYSDSGFILLGLLLERIGGAPLDVQFSGLTKQITAPLLYRPPSALVDRIAPTEFDPWRGRLIRGEVHDENAAFLGGVAGHAGLFGTAEAVGAFARIVLDTFQRDTWMGSPALMGTFATRAAHVPGSSRALGWDTMLPTSSCGTRMSRTAIGHTGFTGTSLWIDHERDLYVAFLTNRVHPTRANTALAAMRSRVHDAVIQDFETDGRA